MDLSISSVSAYSQSQTAGAAQIAVEAKALNIARQQGNAALQLLQNASQAGDPLAAKATGLGGALDTFA